jgi:RNA polymerase sigma-70 factor (ECF subfamily)
MLLKDGVAGLRDSETADARFEALFRDTYEPVLRAMYLFTGDRQEAEDLTQEAFARVLERWPAIDPGTNPAGYVYRTALNLSRTRRRRLSGLLRPLALSAQVDKEVESGYGRIEERDRLRRMLRTLPRGQREALVLVEWLRLSDREAASLLHVSPVAVRVRIARAKKALRSAEGGQSSE